MKLRKLNAILALIAAYAPEADVEGELDHAGFGNTLKIKYSGPGVPPSILPPDWNDEVFLHMHKHDEAIVVVNGD